MLLTEAKRKWDVEELVWFEVYKKLGILLKIGLEGLERKVDALGNH